MLYYFILKYFSTYPFFRIPVALIKGLYFAEEFLLREKLILDRNYFLKLYSVASAKKKKKKYYYFLYSIYSLRFNKNNLLTFWLQSWEWNISPFLQIREYILIERFLTTGSWNNLYILKKLLFLIYISEIHVKRRQTWE